jgi:hypothetical protein
MDSLLDINPAEDRIRLNLATFAVLPVGSRPGCHWHPSLRFLLVATILISIPPGLARTPPLASSKPGGVHVKKPCGRPAFLARRSPFAYSDKNTLELNPFFDVKCSR